MKVQIQIIRIYYKVVVKILRHDKFSKFQQGFEVGYTTVNHVIWHTGAFYCISFLTFPTVFSKIFLFSTLYISSFLKPFVLLRSLLKYLLLLKSLTLQPLWLFPPVFLYFIKVYQLCSTILWFLYLLQCFIHRHSYITTLIGSFPLENSVVNLNCLLNKTYYIFSVFHKY